MPDRIVRYVLAGDASGAVRAMRQAEVASTETGHALERTGAEAEGSFGAIEASAGRLRGSIGALAGAAGLGGLVFGLKDAVEAGIHLQDQQAQLRNALANTGQLSAETVKALTEASEEASTHGGFSAADELGGMTQLVRLTHDSSKAVKLNAEAVNIARGSHLSYSAAIKVVAQAQNGNFRGLQRLVGVIQPVTTNVDALTAAQKRQNPELLKHAKLLDKQAAAAAANAQITKRFGGAAEEFGNTAAGAASNARNALDQLQERIGTALLPTVTKAAQGMTHLVEVVQKNWPQISETVKQVTAPISWMAREVGKNKGAVEGLTLALAAGVATYGAFKLAVVGAEAAQALWTITTIAATAASGDMTGAMVALDLAFDANPVGLVIAGIAALAAGLIYAYHHSKTFHHAVDETFDKLKEFAGWISRHWRTTVEILGAPLEPLVQVLLHIKSLIHDVTWAAGKVEGIYHAVSGVPGSVGHFVNGLVPHHAFGGMVAGVGGADNVPILATPGEAVLRRNAVAAIGGARGVAALNSGQGGEHVFHLTIPAIMMTPEGRVLAETVTHHQLRMAARK